MSVEYACGLSRRWSRHQAQHPPALDPQIGAAVIGGISALFDAFLGSGAMAWRLRQHLCERSLNSGKQIKTISPLSLRCTNLSDQLCGACKCCRAVGVEPTGCRDSKRVGKVVPLLPSTKL